MCGRARAARGEEVLGAATRVAERSSRGAEWPDEASYRASPNAHPGMRLASMQIDGNVVRVRCRVWGLGDDPWRKFNARSETAGTVFRKYIDSRCLIVLDGFYEWAAGGPAHSEKQPHFAARADGAPLLVAGLCDDDDKCTILTRDVVPSLAWLHDRMPVILPDEDAALAWLDTGKCNVQPPPIKTHPVSKKMSKLAYQDEDASKPVKPHAKLTDFFACRPKRPIEKTSEEEATQHKKLACS